MNLFQDFIESHFRRVESRMPNVEKRESGPSWMDKTSDEYYAPEVAEVTEERGDWADSQWGNEPRELTPKEEQLLKGWE